MNPAIIEKAQALGLHLYQGTYTEDIHLLKWWMELNETGEIREAFPKAVHPLAEFMHLFKPPRTLIYALTDDKLWYATWLEPFLHGTYLSTWVDESMHGTKTHLKVALTIYEGVLNVYPVILSMAYSKELAELAQKAGYVSLGEVPNLHNGNGLYFTYLTKPGLEASKIYQLGAEL